MNLLTSVNDTPSTTTTSPSPREPLREGDYVTDQRRLFRVLQIVPARLNKRAAILEDCRTLEATLFRPKELRRMRLQLVRRTQVAGQP
jgi:hypothetical protein